MVNDRRIEVLRAIVSDYVRTREPVGSRALVERYDLQVSPATIRNDMAHLEENGLICQPHTSAGRVPTNEGYRMFVDQLSALKPLSAPQRHAIEEFLTAATDINGVVDRAVRLLAQLTQQVAVIQYPNLRNASLRHVELVVLNPRRLLLVAIIDSGQVKQITVETRDDLELNTVTLLRDQINSRVLGIGAGQVPTILATLSGEFPENKRSLVESVVSALSTIIAGHETDEQMVVAGTSNLARANVDFTHSIVPVLDALEEQVTLLRLFAEVGAEDVGVSIGAENKHDGLAEVAVVTGTYGSDSTETAHLGVVGPTRMDYPATITAVRAVARYLSRYLAK